MVFLKSFLNFLKLRKKYWLTPTVIILILYSLLLLIAENSSLTPFFYSNF